MSPGLAVQLVTRALMVALMVSAPLLATALLVGVLVSLVQALTQIQEQTLTFIPKLLAMIAVMVVAGPWMTSTMMDYIIRLYSSIPSLIG